MLNKKPILRFVHCGAEPFNGNLLPRHRVIYQLSDTEMRTVTYELVGILEGKIPELRNGIYRLDGRTAKGMKIKENKRPRGVTS